MSCSLDGASGYGIIFVLGADFEREDARVSTEESGEWSQAIILESQYTSKVGASWI